MLAQTLGIVSERALKEPSNARFGSGVVLLISEVCADLQKNVEMD